MLKYIKKTYVKNEAMAWHYPNHWDIAAGVFVFALIALLALGAKGMTTTYHLGEAIPISLDPTHLPYYALRSVMRMLIGLVLSLLFTFTVGTLAAKNKHAERMIVPLIDVMQSVPVLGYLSITVVPFILLFPNSMLGPECAAIFAIFTAQVWNITLSFYQSMRTVPEDLVEASRMFRLSSWQTFWRIEVPFAMPGLLWNVMMSMSASWFFVVASEAITVANQKIMLPGIGSYIAMAIAKADVKTVFYAIGTMLIVILLYDQLLFRPLSQWIEKFKYQEMADEEEDTAWLINFFQKTRALKKIGDFLNILWDSFVNLPYFKTKKSEATQHIEKAFHRILLMFWYGFLLLAMAGALGVLGRYIVANVTLSEIGHVFFLGVVTGIKVMVLIVISTFIWVPVGVWIGLRPKIARRLQPVIQFLASFPANLFFPLVVIAIVTFHLNAEIWTAPLMVLGTQWYILFNVIAGTLVLPKELKYVAMNFNVKGWLWWRRLILPGIFPYFITGAITAAGGAWNASIIAETVSWGATKIEATGLGTYITHYATLGDFPRLALGVAVMCLYVLLVNYLLWRPLYNLAESRFSIGQKT